MLKADAEKKTRQVTHEPFNDTSFRVGGKSYEAIPAAAANDLSKFINRVILGRHPIGTN